MPTMSMPAMPTMPAMPAMPNVALPNVGLPNIPGLKKNSTSGEAESAVEAAENTSGAAGGGGDDDEDRSRYIRYVGLAKWMKAIFLHTKTKKK